jgi:uncharacterized protein with ACT and thioredoxin-like domain
MGKKSNRDAYGARIRLTAGGRTLVREVSGGASYLGQGDTRAHFGLGDRARVDTLEIRWPSGLREEIRNVAANQIVTIREGDGVITAVPFARGTR